MSPEQASGEPVDARSDVFSFGVVIFEALTGRLPFNGETRRDYLKNLIATQPEPLPPPVPAALRAVVERCLSKNPDDRFASGKELTQAIREAADKPSLTWRLRATVAILALAVVAVGVWGVLRSKSAETVLLQGPLQLIATWASNETNPRISPDLGGSRSSPIETVRMRSSFANARRDSNKRSLHPAASCSVPMNGHHRAIRSRM